MSGGCFDFAYLRTTRFADELQVKLDCYNWQDALGNAPYSFPPDVHAKLRDIERLARRTARLMRAAEWLCSGDTSEDSFMDEIRQIEAEKP